MAILRKSNPEIDATSAKDELSALAEIEGRPAEALAPAQSPQRPEAIGTALRKSGPFR